MHTHEQPKYKKDPMQGQLKLHLLYLQAMQPTNLLALVFTSFLGTNGVQAVGNFGASCVNLSLIGTTLYGGCKYGNTGRYLGTSIDMNACIANLNGNLVCQNGGNYGAFCTGCSLSGTWIKCTCGGGGAGTIDLNQCIVNRDGNLACD
ncbi:hypothetical protein CTheo_7578 [Ceratobasidium theobromae]|uniref:Cyanovirin-N domain-containing protein n=1 Tax=Ceratobasidium theobromae TaxID=1582974 RepID=A0A5N5QBU6_9AGAM|nr:hypothetical protein CTheo_7578 [Ceratobasidium theobromae]